MPPGVPSNVLLSPRPIAPPPHPTVSFRATATLPFDALATSAITHPFVYLGFTLLMTPGTIRYALVAESFAVGVEAWWLHRCANGRLTITDALLWSLVANAASVAVGSSLDALWP